MSRYSWVHHNGTTLHQVGILDDGTLHNPRGYPEDLVREAVLAADVQVKKQRSAAAKKAAVTRAARQKRRVYSIAAKMSESSPIGPRSNCAVCGRGLGDPESIERGIGSECWQDVLREISKLKATQPRTRGGAR
jgi:hypothetical protein